MAKRIIVAVLLAAVLLMSVLTGCSQSADVSNREFNLSDVKNDNTNNISKEATVDQESLVKLCLNYNERLEYTNGGKNVTIDREEYALLCVSRLAIENHNPDLCLFLTGKTSDYSFKNYCLASYNDKFQDKTICDMMDMGDEFSTECPRYNYDK